jgi:hypothetical protein
VEGVRREAAFLDGGYADVLQMGLLQPDLAAADAAGPVGETS